MDFEKYEKELHPDKYKKTYSWEIAIGLQKVDDLKPSEFLYDVAKKNIEEDLSFNEAKELLNSYYKEKPVHFDRTEEADKVSLRIAEIICSDSFVFSPVEYINIHKKLFEGIYDHAGKIRDYNISKKEWVLDGDTISYGDAYNLNDLLEYDFKQEKNFDYSGLTKTEFIKHIAKFISDLWQIHIFGEGNTRTTAVFLIKYLKKHGFEIDNSLFSEHSWYFRNALVRANYSNYLKGISETSKYLEMFLENLLFNYNHKLSNKELHILYKQGENVQYKIKERKQKMIDILKEEPNVTLEYCAKKLNLSLRTIKSCIQELKNENLIERVGSKKKGYWKTK